MSTFTMRTKEVLENVFGTSPDKYDYEIEYRPYEYAGVKYGALPFIPDPKLIGLGTYPIFDEAYRPILNGKIIDEYFNREIGAETIDDWKLMIRRKMDQIMPRYNQLYEAEKLIFDPFATIDIVTNRTEVVDGKEQSTALSETESERDDTGTETRESTDSVDTTNSSSSSTTSKSRAVASETPQMALAGNEDYATNSQDSKSTSSVTANTDQNAETISSGESETSSNSKLTGTVSNTGENKTDIENTVESRTKGYQAIATDLLIKYRDSRTEFDTSIIRELEDCFMLVLNNGDTYSLSDWPYYG